MRVPELELELTSGTLGGVVTTVEGLISKICESEYSYCSLLPIDHLIVLCTQFGLPFVNRIE